jgi:hypothetical protein
MHNCAGARTVLVRCASVFALISSIGCNASLPTEASAPVSATTLEVLYGSTSCQPLRVGSSAFFSAYTVTGDGVYQHVTPHVSWSSSDPGVLRPGSSISSSFPLLAPGTAEVRAQYQGLFGATSVTVHGQGPPQLEVDFFNPVRNGSTPLSARLRTGSGAPITIVTASTTFTSSNPRVATIEGSQLSFTGAVGNVEVRGAYNGITGACGIAQSPRAF